MRMGWDGAGARMGRAALMSLVVVACEGADPLGPDVPVDMVELSPSVPELIVGDTLRMAAQARSASGRVLPGRAIAWSSDKSDVASVDSLGLVTAHTVGTAMVKASTGGKDGVMQVRVAPVPVASVELSSEPESLSVGDSLRFTAIARDAMGRELSGRSFSWTSDRADVASVDPSGRVRAHAPGQALITATSGAASASATVTVTAATPVLTSLEPSSIQAGWGNFTLVARGARFGASARVHWNGQPLQSVVFSGTEIQATVTSSHVASAGTAVVTVQTPLPDERISNALDFVVFERPALSVELRVPGNAVFLGNSVKLDAVARDQFGAIIEGKTITWTSSDTLRARIDGGMVRGLAVGSVSLTAFAYPASASMTFNVLTAPSSDVVYQASPSGYPELFVRSLAPGGSFRRLRPPGTYGAQAAVSPNGGKIAFVGSDDGNLDVYVVNRDGSGLLRLTNEVGIDDQPAWSPDGEWIAFRSFRDGKSDIWTMRADGSDPVNRTYADVSVPEEYNDAPAWSPDGQRIAFSRGFGTGQSIGTIRPDGSELTELIPYASGFDRLQPAWSPNGQVLAYRNRDRSTGLGRIDFARADTGEPLFYWQGLMTDGASPAWLDDDWLAVTALSLPGTTIRTVTLVRLGPGFQVVPLGADWGSLDEPVGISR